MSCIELSLVCIDEKPSLGILFRNALSECSAEATSLASFSAWHPYPLKASLDLLKQISLDPNRLICSSVFVQFLFSLSAVVLNTI